MSIHQAYSNAQTALSELQEEAERAGFAATFIESQIASSMLSEAFAFDSDHAG